MKLLHIVGNRPQFIKLAPLLRATAKYSIIQNVIVHSGQHYDYEMSKIFFDELGIPSPHYHLNVGSGTHGVQTGTVMARLDEVLINERPDVVLVYGDTNTTLAGALAGYKFHIPVAHVEAGLREHKWRPEEMNKKIADHCSDYLFCPTKKAEQNLKNEGIDSRKIFLTGDITYDIFLLAEEKLTTKNNILDVDENYCLMTLHRAETVDDDFFIRQVIEAVMELEQKVLFPVHPRTLKKLREFGLFNQLASSNKVRIMEPLGYYEFLKILLSAKMVLTDSGGVIKEAFYARKPCITLDNSTEYSEILETGANILAGKTKNGILKAIRQMEGFDFSAVFINNVFGDGNAAAIMISILLSKCK
jgi:UDP-N-acetylglucosamine 2-epimerase